jgi:hypothetical protein
MKTKHCVLFAIVFSLTFQGCKLPEPKKDKSITEKHNYIILLDLSDRLIVQYKQPNRDIEIIKAIYRLFEEKVRQELYIRSRDEIKVVIAPQRGSGLPTEIFEDKLYINMGNIQNIYRRSGEEERRQQFFANLDTLYQEAAFSTEPEDFYGADIWKYFYEDLQNDCSTDTLTKNYLFILTDGYPIVGHDTNKLEPVNKSFPNLRIALVEAAPREKDMEWDRIMDLWTRWFGKMDIEHYEFIKRRALTKETEQITDFISRGADE